MMDFNIFGDFYSKGKEHQILKFPVKLTHCTSFFLQTLKYPSL